MTRAAGRQRPQRQLRRWLLATWCLCLALAVLAGEGRPGQWWPGTTAIADIPLYADGISMDPYGARTLIPPSDPSTGTAVQATRAVTAQEAAWLAEGSRPGEGTAYDDMATRALLDLRALTLEVSGPADTSAAGGQVTAPRAALAAWTPHWNYVWPRDASFVAVALARTGHTDEAVGILVFLAAVQADDGTFEARYLPDMSGATPDDRAAQTDGVGWVLWAADQTLAAVPATERSRAWDQIRPMVTAAARAALRLTRNGTTLPPASPDYWEVKEATPTLGTAAPLLAGLESAGRLLGDPVAAAALTYRAVVETSFGAAGYPRRLGDRAGTIRRDTASAFVLPPYVSTPLSGALDAWRASQPAMLRPAGGLSPGAAWREDGVSWTPTTSLYALAAASNGDRQQAEQWLTWLDEHRTAAGSLPEKVLADGSPASVAPLSWTAASVILTLSELDR